ncbi:transposase [Planctomicrobium sp. SH664]|uniref:transposase n=1 Tax=Planctomicrobium sp. SH664 TaxID=3448125 RepID=UPI003F5C76F0
MLNKVRPRQWVVDALQQLREQQQVALWADVIMPEHVHILLDPREPDYEMRRILAAIKSPVSRQAKAFLQAAGEVDWLQRLTVHRGGRTVFQFWQAGGGYAQNLWNDRPIQAVLGYIHANPVRRGLVGRPTDWKWSSARAHAGDMDVPLRMDPVDLS